MLEELDPVVIPLDKLLGGIECCLYDGNCTKCPLWGDVKPANKTRSDCMSDMLYHAEMHLKGYGKKKEGV